MSCGETESFLIVLRRSCSIVVGEEGNVVTVIALILVPHHSSKPDHDSTTITEGRNLLIS
jgi:hypothetical protein